MTAAATAAPFEQFNWKPQPEGQKVLDGLLADFLRRCPDAQRLADRMRDETATRFFDWVDHIKAPDSKDLRARLEDTGFTLQPDPVESVRYIHDGAMFPQVLLGGDTLRVGIKAEFVADFLAAHQVTPEHAIQGEPLSRLRLAPAFAGDKAELWVVERRGYRGFELEKHDPAKAIKMLRHLEAFRRRNRDFAEDAQGFEHAQSLIRAAIADLGVDLACHIFFEAERDYWMRRNHAGRIQFQRQERLGLGWANHDHHTYRSSRVCFKPLIETFELLGFRCRERFYAGEEAGWGAQVIEQPVAGITIFADVDLSPEEVIGDFAHEDLLPPRESLGTVGLWCGLHGESFLQAGMHHLEAQFDHKMLVRQLETAGVRTMDPFTTFPFLRQAFTEGERWGVAENRLRRLVEKNLIAPELAEKFRKEGAVGSHLENLERNDGFKGFNQQGVSDIIRRTDPRFAKAAAGDA